MIGDRGVIAGVFVPPLLTREPWITLVVVQAARITELTAANEVLAAKLAKAEHLLSRNSANSSSPPSKDDDLGETPPPAKPKRGDEPPRKRGKQPRRAGLASGVHRPPQ